MPDDPNFLSIPWRESHASIYADGTSATQTSEVHSVGSHGVRVIRFERGSNANVDPPCPDLVLGLDLGGSPNVRWSWGDRWREHPARRKGWFGLSPVGEPGFFEVEGRHRVLVISFPLGRLKTVLDDDVNQLRSDYGDLHDRYRQDRHVSFMANHLFELSLTPSPASQFEADTTVYFLLARLGSLANEKKPLEVQAVERFNLRQQATVVDYIEANLSKQIQIEKLAKQVHMSVRQFHGYFVSTFGLAPHRFVMHRRVMRAKSLIESGTELAEAAFECGFSDQSHLTRVFKKTLGILPSSLRP